MKPRQIKLTKKQQKVVELFACDYSIPEAAVLLGIARRSLEEMVQRIKKKLNVKHAQGVVGEAIRHGLIDIFNLKKKKRP